MGVAEIIIFVDDRSGNSVCMEGLSLTGLKMGFDLSGSKEKADFLSLLTCNIYSYENSSGSVGSLFLSLMPLLQNVRSFC